ncbi:MAG: 1,2-phenylacetyl-CoA epoxidase subunit PaaC [Candidatus Dadabacteria bacterium]
MLTRSQIFIYTLHLADNNLLMAQRNSEWTGHGPVLEQDIAITNISLDQLGEARNFYQYAATLYNGFDEEQKLAVDKYIPRLWKDYNRDLQEDDLAFLRDEHQYINLLITELPKGDWAYTVLKQFFYAVFQQLQYRGLQQSNDAQLSAIAEKSLKEVAYHVRWSSEWVVRLGDGTEESARRITAALADLWMFTGEMFQLQDWEMVDVASLKELWMQQLQDVFKNATLEVPKQTWMQSGGKLGRHTEYMGYLLSEMQYMQRAYPNLTW